MEFPQEARIVAPGRCHIRALIQRVSEASVQADGDTVASIGKGFVVLLGVRKGDLPESADFLAQKVAGLRIFADAEGKMSLALADVGGEVLVVSQMTLYGDCSKGRRPSFDAVAAGPEARPLYEAFVERLKAAGIRVQTGIFGAMQTVQLANDGPVTFMLEAG